MAERVSLGIIGGSGLYAMESLEDAREVRVETPFGSPSAPYVVGKLGGRRVAFLSRHGAGHTISPSELNFRANIYGMKKLGADAVISVSAVGSLREEIAPGDFVVPNQFIDRTRGRVSTFFGGGVVAHVSFADPVCAAVSASVVAAVRSAGGKVHEGGTYVCMEGPQFSTRAESHLYRGWGAQVIGMTNLQEAKLAREAEMCFVTVAMATDYDCWREADDVDVAEILATLQANAALAKKTVTAAAAALHDDRACRCRRALDGAVITAREAIPEARKKELALILDPAFSRS